MHRNCPIHSDINPECKDCVPDFANRWARVSELEEENARLRRMLDMRERDWTKEPKSIMALRAERNENAADWTGRDALIDVLASLDAGEIEPKTMLITWWDDIRYKNGDGPVRYVAANANAVDMLGLVERAKFLMMNPTQQW